MHMCLYCTSICDNQKWYIYWRDSGHLTQQRRMAFKFLPSRLRSNHITGITFQGLTNCPTLINPRRHPRVTCSTGCRIGSWDRTQRVAAIEEAVSEKERYTHMIAQYMVSTLAPRKYHLEDGYSIIFSNILTNMIHAGQCFNVKQTIPN